jgi:CRP/FNR family cyclic AMP-dependent transcriptional regulator
MALPARPSSPPRPGSGPKLTSVASGPLTRRLKKGELLFAEGENSRAMYFLKNGMIRIFKKKGDSAIEIDTVRTGQILGELAFLDGNPRSASGEALTDCELMEISGPTFQEVLGKMPDWLKLLLKTVVGRLRTASTRIRQLETASTAYDYSDKDGKRSQHYVYLSPNDVLKVASALLLVATRNGTKGAEGTDIRPGLLQRYANQIMGIPVAKITTLMDVFAQVGILSLGADGDTVSVLDADFLEASISYLNEEYLLEPSKRHDLSIKGFMIMGYMAKHMARGRKDEVAGVTHLNLAEIRKLETTEGGKEPFRMEEFPELVKLGYASNVNLKSSDEVFTTVKAESFIKAFRLQRVVMAIAAENEKKRKGGK